MGNNNKAIFLLPFLIFAAYGFTTIGSNLFFANILYSNANYGFGAVFPCNVWFNGNLGLLRVDYYSPNGTKFLSTMYNYTSHDKYEVCGSSCSRATYNTPMPIFYGTPSTYATTACQTPDYPGPKACTNYPSCYSFLSSPNQPQGIYSLSYIDSTFYQLCLVRFTAQTGFTYGPEWQIVQYIDGTHVGTFNTTTNPTPSSVYSSVIASVTCPQPTCFAVLDIALIVDESGSIFQASAWNDVQAFVANLLSSLQIGPNQIRVGLAYFSGLDSCSQNFTGSSIVGCGGGCGVCGGTWSPLTIGLLTDKSTLLNLAANHVAYEGYTCISCGIDVGIKLLNYAPKANVQKIIILFTDGAQNRITSGLTTNAKYAYDQQINIIAIGTGNYKLSDLQVFSNTIYTTANFNQLSSLINSIITPLCQALPSIDTCNFCSGLCSCTASCNCPVCYGANLCYPQNCDTRAPPLGTSGICVTVPKICDDSNPCTVNNCINATGCDYSQATPLPNGYVQTFCRQYICTNPAGFQLTDIGATQCTGGDLCNIRYCNTTVGTTGSLQGSCQNINRSSPAYPSGTSITYANSAIPAQVITVSGCGAPSTAAPCQVYYCDPATGNCAINSSSCKCLVNSDCNDGDGCTIDTCNTTLNKCLHTSVDCYSDLSNGQCITGVAFTGTNATGSSFYNGVGTFNVDGTGLPSPNSQSRSCDLLACYGGLKSTYTCQAKSNTTYVCLRQTSPCTSTACTDSVCTTTGTWSSGQANTNCAATYPVPCTTTNRCLSPSCNGSWSGVSCVSSGSCSSNTGGLRCVTTSNATNCNNPNLCAFSGCNPASGCYSLNYTFAQPNPCLINTCNSSTGNYTTVNTTACPPVANLCNVTYCNTTTKSCQYIDRSTLKIGQTVSYIDSYGVTQTVSGCASSVASCVVFGCTPGTGQCFTNVSGCNCTNNAACNDGNGCTFDYCNTTTGGCVYTPYDCYNISSNGLCITGQVLSSSNTTTGQNNYNQGSPVNTFVVGNYYCDQLACYSGQRSQYTCQSTGNYSYTCARSVTTCQKGGCQDTACRTLTTWQNGILTTDCFVAYTPTCTSNACLTSQCNSSYVYGTNDARCISNSNASLCTNGGNLCKVAGCDNTNGCTLSDLPQPIPNNLCANYSCTPSLGWQPNNIGSSSCPNNPGNDLCVIQYCNTSSLTCQQINKRNIPLGSTVSYVDSDGNTYTVSGCQKPSSDPLACRTYDCDANTGSCTTSTSTCVCTSDTSCQDGNGCSIDVCDFRLNQCNRTYIDCFSILSNGSCTMNGAYQSDILTGLNLYYNNASSNNVYSQVDANGLPYPNTGVKRTCGQLGCYAGQPSNYSCFSIQEGSYQCQRYTLNCSRNGCQDNICRTLGGWNGQNQLNTDCGTTYRPNCAVNDACIQNFCNSTWVPSSPVSQRCIHIPVNASQVCDDGNFCTIDYCDSQSTSGNICKHKLYNEQVLKNTICSTNQSTVCQTVQCTVNKCIWTDVQCLPATLCIFYTCNSTTNGTCQAFPTGIYTIDKCGVCGGNGLSCIPDSPGNPKKTSIIVALAVGLTVGLVCAAIIAAILTKTSYAAYQALGTEIQGTVQSNPTHKGNEESFEVPHN